MDVNDLQWVNLFHQKKVNGGKHFVITYSCQKVIQNKDFHYTVHQWLDLEKYAVMTGGKMKYE